MSADALYRELVGHLRKAGVEIRVETFKTPPDSAGGLCKVRGANLILLHSGASPGERSSALLEAVETIGLEPLGLAGRDLSPALLARLNRRGHMPWPHRSRAPGVAWTSLEDDDEPPVSR